MASETFNYTGSEQTWNVPDQVTEITVTAEGGGGGGGGDADGHVRRYEDLRQYGDFAGSMTVDRAANGQPHFTESLPADASVDSLVLDFVPGADVDATSGFWDIVRSVDDETRFAADVGRLTVQVAVLAELYEYASRSDVQADLGEGVA